MLILTSTVGLWLTSNFISDAPKIICGHVWLLQSVDHNSAAKNSSARASIRGAISSIVVIAPLRGRGRGNVFSQLKKKTKPKTISCINLGAMVLKSPERLVHIQICFFLAPRRPISSFFRDSCQYSPHGFSSYPLIFLPRPIYLLYTCKWTCNSLSLIQLRGRV